jgi:hypothetical protein
LAANAADPQFRSDLDLLVTGGLDDYDVDRTATELTLWSDRYLDPLYDARRSPSAITREQRKWAHHGWAPSSLRCPHHDVTPNGVTRCPWWHEPGGHCPDHPVP